VGSAGFLSMIVVRLGRGRDRKFVLVAANDQKVARKAATHPGPT
jgi:hypothetical protein